MMITLNHPKTGNQQTTSIKHSLKDLMNFQTEIKTTVAGTRNINEKILIHNHAVISSRSSC